MSEELESELLHRGDIVVHDEYGRVKIMDFDERVTGIGVFDVERDIYVKFTTKPDAPAIRSSSVMDVPKDEFLEAVWEE